MDPTQIKKLVKTARASDDFDSCYGPTPLGDCEVWEVWVYDNEADEYATRFAIVNKRGECSLLSSFTDYNNRAHNLIRSVEDARHEKRVKLYVAATVFVASVLVTLIIVLRGGESGAALITCMTGLIASGAIMFFGQWKPGGS